MTRRTSHAALLLFLLLAIALPVSCSAGTIQTVFGNDIPLSGTAPGSDFIYLFLTGPNLPDGGISLAGGTPVVTGNAASFTRVEVNTDGSWSYTWSTGSTGRVLDQGTYVIYIVQEPRALPDLDDAVYTTQAVVFGQPVVTVTLTLVTPPTTGSLVVDSSPGMSMVSLDGNPAGITPLQISDIPAGSHTLVIIHDGYSPYRADIVISAGETRDISAVLQPLIPLANPTTLVPPTTPPGRLASFTLVPLGAVALAVFVLGRRRR